MKLNDINAEGHASTKLCAGPWHRSSIDGGGAGWVVAWLVVVGSGEAGWVVAWLGWRQPFATTGETVLGYLKFLFKSSLVFHELFFRYVLTQLQQLTILSRLCFA